MAKASMEEIERELQYAVEDGRLEADEAMALMEDEKAARFWYDSQVIGADPY